HQTGEDNFGLSGPPSRFGKFADRSDHRSNGAFGVASATSKEAAVELPRSKLRFGGIDGVEMRRQQDALPYFAGRGQAGKEVGPSGQDRLELHFQSSASGNCGQAFCNALLSRFWVSCRKKRGVNAA